MIKISSPQKLIILIVTAALLFLPVFMGQHLRAYVLSMNGPLADIPTREWSVVVIPILSIGFLIGFLIYTRMGSRAGGVVVVPLAVVEALAYPLLIPLIVTGSIVSYIIGMIFFEEFLIYGRRLFYVFLTVSILVMTVPVISIIPHSLNFSTLLPGIVAYNMHVEKSLTKAIAIVLICFSALFLLGLMIIDVYEVILYA